LGPDSLILDDWWKSDGGLGYSVGKSLLVTLGAVFFCPKVLFSCNPYFLNLVSLFFSPGWKMHWKLISVYLLVIHSFEPDIPLFFPPQWKMLWKLISM
jgi:hypothetical protein